MSTRLSDLSIADLALLLRATEQSAGKESVSARLIRRALDEKRAAIKPGGRSR